MKNNPQKSLRSKVGRIITAFSFFMVVFYSYMMLLSKDSGLRDATHAVLIHETKLFIEAYKKDPSTPLPRSYSLRGFIGEESLPEEITKFFPLQERETWHQRKSGVYHRLTFADGYHSFHHIYARKLPNSEKEFFLYYLLRTPEDNKLAVWNNVKQVSIFSVILIVILLLVLRKFIHRALAPISSLSTWISQLDDDKTPPPLPKDIQDDEIGHLANNLFDALARIHLQNQRERSFLRNASHELRTPIAIIRNTMDVIEHKGITNEHPELGRLAMRIRRASDTMKAVTEAILWLALDQYSAPQKNQTDLQQLMTEVIDENRNLIQDKNININADLGQLESLNIETALAHITLDNLIRNAFQHCSGGDICVKAVGPAEIQISNNRYDDTKINEEKREHFVNTGGFGLGIVLVQKIAQKKHWAFDFSLENDYATARLCFAE